MPPQPQELYLVQLFLYSGEKNVTLAQTGGIQDEEKECLFGT